MTESSVVMEPARVIETPQAQEDYFGFNETHTFTFPDGMTFIEFKSLNEGAKSQYQKRTQSDFVLERKSGDARMKLDQASMRHELIKSSVTGWNLIRQGSALPFNDRNLRDWLELANPTLVEDLYSAIQKANPWLQAEMTVEDIDKEIENLQEMRKAAVEREQGK